MRHHVLVNVLLITVYSSITLRGGHSLLNISAELRYDRLKNMYLCILVRRTVLKKTCTDDLTCNHDNTACIAGMCVCRHGYVERNGECGK